MCSCLRKQVRVRNNMMIRWKNPHVWKSTKIHPTRCAAYEQARSLAGAAVQSFRRTNGPRMQSIVNVHIGGCGLRTADGLWETLRAEHGIGADGTPAASTARGSQVGRRVYFHEDSDGSWRPRGVLVDTHPGM